MCFIMTITAPSDSVQCQNNNVTTLFRHVHVLLQKGVRNSCIDITSKEPNIFKKYVQKVCPLLRGLKIGFCMIERNSSRGLNPRM